MDGHSRLDSIRTPKVERVLRKQFHHCREYVTGTLCLTDRHLIFIEPTGAQETWLLYHHILSMERKPLTTKGYPLLIDCKTFQQLNLIIPRESDCLDVIDTIKNFSQPDSYRDLFAFQYQPLDMEPLKKSSGWVLYDSESEYGRMGIPNQYWKSTNLNEHYEICDTYSSSLYVPVIADNAIITGSAKFRSRGRLPVLSYYYSPKKTALCRSSQPLVGLRGRSLEDEQMIQCIVDANPNADVMYMIDTRPKINAIANKAKGKGYESTDHYINVIYEFFNIHNIHVMRESLQKLVEASCSPKETLSGFLLGIENSGWMKHIHLVLEASIFSAKALCVEGRSVLVHCSDGWDRTAQTCALVSLLIDSHYRTLHGFMILVEKEWLCFGHKFSIRSGHLAGDIRESSPIFTQFLDCVWQIMIQFPTAFQFNEHFLVTLHDHVYSCQFGTFLGNCERDRVLNMFSEQTYSFWGYVWAHLDDFINPLYSAASAQEELLLPNTDVPQLSFWLGLYCRYPLRQHVCELSDEVTGSLKQQNTCLTEHIKFVQKNIEELRVQLARFEDENAHNIVSNSASTDCTHKKEEDKEEKEDEKEEKEEEKEEEHVKNSDSLNNSTAGSCDISADIDIKLQSKQSDTLSEVKGTEKVKTGEDEQEETLTTGMKSGCSSSEQAILCDNGFPERGNDNIAPIDREENREASNEADKKNSKRKKPKPLDSFIPPSTLCGSAQTEESPGVQTDPTEVMSPRSYSVFKNNLIHIPEMNLPWGSMRNTSKCMCGVTFSYSVRKYHCSHCGCVVCGSCGNNQAALPWQSTPKPHRVCKSCFKITKKIMQEEAVTQIT